MGVQRKFVNLLLLVPALLWGYIGWAKADFALKSRYGAVRDRQSGAAYGVREYGGYENAMHACLFREDGLPRERVCGPAWK